MKQNKLYGRLDELENGNERHTHTEREREKERQRREGAHGNGSSNSIIAMEHWFLKVFRQ